MTRAPSAKTKAASKGAATATTGIYRFILRFKDGVAYRIFVFAASEQEAIRKAERACKPRLRQGHVIDGGPDGFVAIRLSPPAKGGVA